MGGLFCTYTWNFRPIYLNIHMPVSCYLPNTVNEFTINISSDKTLFKFILPLELYLQVFFFLLQTKFMVILLKKFLSNSRTWNIFSFSLLFHWNMRLFRSHFRLGFDFIYFYENVSSVSFSHSDKNSSHKTIYLFLFVLLSRQTSFFFVVLDTFIGSFWC